MLSLPCEIRHNFQVKPCVSVRTCTQHHKVRVLQLQRKYSTSLHISNEWCTTLFVLLHSQVVAVDPHSACSNIQQQQQQQESIACHTEHHIVPNSHTAGNQQWLCGYDVKTLLMLRTCRDTKCNNAMGLDCSACGNTH
jgi:hypothetical protein